MNRPAAATFRDIYLNRRMAVLLGLGFASGLPSAYRLLGSTLQAWLGSYDIDVRTIGLFTLVGLPFTFNFVWAPLLDRLLPPGRLSLLGRRRGWLVVIQACLMVAIAAMAVAGPTDGDDKLMWLAVAGLVVAFLAASQDVVADAYRTDVLPDEELGAGAALFVNGYRLAMIAAGGGALLLASYLPWRMVYLAMALLMGLGIVASLLAPAPPDQGRPGSLRESVVDPVRDFMARKGMAAWAVLLFVVLFKLPDAMANAMTMPLLQKELQFDQRVIAVVREWVGLGGMVVGSLCGGAMVARAGVVRSLWVFGVLQAVSNLGFLLLAMVGPSVAMLVGVVIVENFCAGLVTAGFIAFLMGQCNRKYSATQYALFTSLMYGAGVVLGSMTGFMVDSLGYVTFFGLSVAAALPGMAMLPWLRVDDRAA